MAPICVLAFFYLTLKQALPLCQVIITPTGIQISHLFPWQRGGYFPHDQIEYYATTNLKKAYPRLPLPKKMKNATIFGLLLPKNEKPILIMGGTMKNFKELNNLLLEIYPQPEPKSQTDTEQHLQLPK